MIRCASIGLATLGVLLVGCGTSGDTASGVAPDRTGRDAVVDQSGDITSADALPDASADAADSQADAAQETDAPDVAPPDATPGDAFEPDADPNPMPDADAPDTSEADTSEADTTDAEVSPGGDGCDSDDLHRYACCVFDQVNVFRAESGLGPYVQDADLEAVAFSYAGFMADTGQFAHSADGLQFGERLDAAGIAWASAGENLQSNTLGDWRAACEETVRGAGGWANSDAGHREAMLGQAADGSDRDWTHAAAGVGRAGGRWYVAMYFVRY